MEVIRSLENLPYHISLVKEVASIRFGEDCNNTLTLNEAILMCDLIRGMCEASNHYVLMEDSIEIFTAITTYEISTFNESIEEFTERKSNIASMNRRGVINTPLSDMESWYCNEAMGRIFNL